MLKKSVLSMVLGLMACTNQSASQTAAADFHKVPPVDGASIAAVLTRVKQEVGLFYSDGAKAEQNWPQLLKVLKVTPVCGDGHIAFQIDSIKMEFAATNDQTGGINGGLKIPFGPPAAGASVGPGVNGSLESTGNIDLVYTYKPLANGPVTSDYDIIRPEAVILPALDHLRDSLVQATGHQPCFQSLGPKDPDQTLTFYVQVIPDVKSSLGFNFYLLSLSASQETRNTYKNTITVSFRPIAFKGGEQNLLAVHKAINDGVAVPKSLLAK